MRPRIEKSKATGSVAVQRLGRSRTRTVLAKRMECDAARRFRSRSDAASHIASLGLPALVVYYFKNFVSGVMKRLGNTWIRLQDKDLGQFLKDGMSGASWFKKLFTWTADVQVNRVEWRRNNEGNWCSEMTRKEQFLAFVFFGALAEDIRSDTTNAQLIAQIAMEIPEDKIPLCPANAAKVFLAFCGGRTERPFRWMLEKESVDVNRS